MKNILVTDDSALMRRVLSDIINKDEELHIDCCAANGLEALEFLKQGKHFDAIVLDLIMPKMSGIEFLQELQKQQMKESVLIVSTIAKEGARETIMALELGAFDFVTKPGSLSDAKSGDFAVKLLERLYVMMGLEWTEAKRIQLLEQFSPAGTVSRDVEVSKMDTLKSIYSKRNMPSADRLRHSDKIAATGSRKLVALACSTGGPKALQEVIPYLPANLDAAVLLVQHMPVGFTASLSNRLDELSAIRVKEARDGEMIQKGTVYIAKGGSQMRLLEKNRQEYCLSVSEEAPRNGLKPCADIMYESLMNTSFDDITCVVMTGMGADATKGILQLEQKKKIYVIAQDEESCTVYGMPKAIAEAGAVDEVHSLKQIAAAITKHVGVR